MQTIRDLLSQLYPYLPTFMIVAVMFGLALVAVAVILLVVARKKGKKKEKPAPKVKDKAVAAEAEAEAAAAAKANGGAVAVQPGKSLTLKESFRRALRILRANVAGRDFRYQIPWYLMIGQYGSGKTSVLRNCGLGQAMADPGGGNAGLLSRLNWWFFDKGVVLDVGGELVLKEDGTGADERSWDRLLHLLQHNRQQKPVDGIVLTIPASELLGDEGNLAKRIREAERRAAMVYAKLWQAQKVLGLRLPVYLLVTKCDMVDGFGAFCTAMPRRLHEGILGWSSPYAVDAAYSPEWAGEAFSAVSQRLSEAQVEIFAEARDIVDPDALFAFPACFGAMFEPLRAYMNQIFQKSVYHESFFFRGIYFCGECQEGGTRSLLQGYPHFLRDLLERKVFPEFTLSRPVARTMLARNRTARWLQTVTLAVVVLWGLGLAAGYWGLHKDIKTLTPLMQDIARDVIQEEQDGGDLRSGMSFLRLLSQPSVRINFEDKALSLFGGMVKTRDADLTSMFYPGSWVSSLHDKIRKSMVTAYDQVIMKAVFIGMIQKLKDVIKTEDIPDSVPTDDLKPQFVEETEQFKDLKVFLEELGQLEHIVERYNGLADSDDLNDLGIIVDYIFDMQVPRDFFTGAQYFHQALREVQYRSLKFSVFRIKFRAKFRKLLNLVYQRSLEANPIMTSLRELQYSLDRFEATGGFEKGTPEGIAELLALMDRTQKVLTRPEYAWLSGSTLNLGPEYEKLIASAEATPMIGQDYVKKYMETGQDRFAKIKAELAMLKSRLTGPLLARKDEVVTLQLSPAVLSLRDALAAFQAQRFMETASDAYRKAAVPAGNRIIWNTRLLSEAIGLADPYKRFLDEQLASFPSELQDTIKREGRDQLQRNMMALIHRAQDIEMHAQGISAGHLEKNIQIEIKNFKEAVPYFLQLQQIFDDLGMAESSIVFSRTVDGQATMLLEAVGAIFDRDNLYVPKRDGLGWWNGHDPLSFAAFDAGDKDELRLYLDIQRRRIEFLAMEYAEPLVAYFLRRPLFENERTQNLVVTWERIIRELDKYERKQPENAITQLEKLILFDLNDITVENYGEKITVDDLERRYGNFFLQRRKQLLSDVNGRCLELSQSAFAAAYNELATFFNESLAGKFPFSKAGPSLGGFNEADPADIRRLFHMYGPYLDSGKKLLQANRRNVIAGDEVLEFLDRLDKTHAFFLPFLSNEELARPEYEVNVDFRVRKDNEIGASNIIEWQFGTPAQQVRFMGEKNQLLWRFGEPVSLTLRWAKNAPVSPLPRSGAPGMTVLDRTVTYDFESNWALVYFMREYMAAREDFAQNKKQRPHVLKFEIDTVPSGAATAGEANNGVYVEPSTARLYVRLGLSAPVKAGEGKENLVQVELPRFPDSAPELKLRSQQAGRQ